MQAEVAFVKVCEGNPILFTIMRSVCGMPPLKDFVNSSFTERVLDIPLIKGVPSKISPYSTSKSDKQSKKVVMNSQLGWQGKLMRLKHYSKQALNTFVKRTTCCSLENVNKHAAKVVGVGKKWPG